MQLELSYEKDEEKGDEVAFEGLCGGPVEAGPAVRGELGHGARHLPRHLRDVLDAPPVVCLHGKVVAHTHPEPDARPVAQEHIEDPVVPPALPKVGQLELKGVLQHLEHHRDDPAEPGVPQDQRLGHPPEEMRRHEKVHLVHHVLPGQAAVLRIGLLGQGHPECRIDQGHPSTSRFGVLEEQHDQRHKVDDADGKDKAPDGRVGSDKRAVAELMQAQEDERQSGSTKSPM